MQGTYETFVEAGRQHFGGSLAGKWILTAGLGGMGGAQPLAATFADACSLNIECQQSRIEFRLKTRYLDEQATDLDDALARIAKYTAEKRAVSIGLLGNAAEILPELVRRAKAGGIKPDIVTDQTSAHDLVNGYLPMGWTLQQWQDARASTAASMPPCATPPRRPARCMCRRCWISPRWASPPSTTATTSARSPTTVASRMHSTSRLCTSLHPAVVLSRQRAVPLGRAVG